jgi:hypothetical protein
MVVLFASTPALGTALHSVLTPSYSVCIADHWWQVEASSPTSWCAVVAIDQLEDSAAFQHLCAFKTRVPAFPVVLVTARDADNARHLKHLVLEEVLWNCEAAAQLRTVVEGMRGRSLFAGLVRELEAAPRLGTHLRTALVYACTSAVPVRSVGTLARAVGRNRCTLAREWRRVMGIRSAPRLEDFLDWVVLLRALELRARGRKWAAVADDADVHPQTLSRIAVRLGGDSLAALAEVGPERLMERFRSALDACIPASAVVTFCDN